MHDSAYVSGILFGMLYGKSGCKVLDIGGQDVNGSVKQAYKISRMNYTCLDIEQHPSVDVVMKPGDPFPFENESFDLIITTACFEHDPCFWMTFREMCRVVKKTGFIYVNAPSNGVYHKCPGDNWRFYSDAGQALAYWSGREIEGKSFPVKITETFHILPKNDSWTDFVCIWQRTDVKETQIVVSDEIKNRQGLLKKALNSVGFQTKSDF